MINESYLDNRFLPLEELNIKDCYICGELLGIDTTTDHIIPTSFFRKGDQNRPKLPVHSTCNNKKSKDDRWCVKFIQFYAGFSVEAKADFKVFMDKAYQEKSYAYLIGQRNSNYKLAMNLFGNIKPGLEIKSNGEVLRQFTISSETAQRVNGWMKLVCRGLYIRNVTLAKPDLPKLQWSQYALSELKGQDQQFITPIQRLINNSNATSFGQKWGNRVSYIGSRAAESADNGYIFIHFYRQVGILAGFGLRKVSRG